LTLALSPLPVQQGGQVLVSGRGFSPGEVVALSAAKAAAGAEVLALGESTASASGTIDAVPLALPDELQSGPHAIEGLGMTSGRRSTGTLWVRAREPWLVLSAYEVRPNGELGLIAGGFEPQASVRGTLEPRSDHALPNVELFTTPTDQVGNTEWVSVKVPLTAPGAYSVVLRGASAGQELRRNMDVIPLKPNVELSPWAGLPGIPVQLNGRGFAPNERVHVGWGAASNEAGVLQADQEGNMWGAGPIRVPQGALTGPLNMVFVGEDSGATASSEFKVLEVKPWLELTSWSGAPGVQVGFGGGGWAAGEAVSFYVGSSGGPVVGAGQADDWGWLKTTGPAIVPADAELDVTFVAVGERSHAVATAKYTLVFPFDLRPSPAPRTP